MPKSAIELLTSGAPWAIMPEMMDTIEAIVNRQTSPEAVAKELGRPLQNTRAVEMRGSVAIIPVSGPIFPKANLFTEISGATSIEILALDFNEALKNPNVKSIILNMDSPGGQVNGINEFAGMVKNATKPVTAYVGGMAASAAYWIASAANEIVIDATAIAGNIGVVVGYSAPKADDPRRELVSSRAPDKRPNLATEQGVAVIQTQIDTVEDVFLNAVASGRGMTVDAVAAIRGNVLVGQAAVSAGLADKLGSLESVIAGLSGGVLTSGGIMPDRNKPNAGGIDPTPPILTATALKADHPEIYQAVFAEGAASVDAVSARTEGATAERERIQAVEKQCIAGHEDLIASFKFDGKTTGGEAAMAVLQAERANHVTNLNAVQHREEPLPHVDAVKDSGMSPKEMAAEARAMVAEAKSKGVTMSVAQAMNKLKEGTE